MTRIKICGNTRREDVELAVELGVDLLGFIFTRSKRHVEVDDVKHVIAQVPSGVERVGVFIDESPEQIAAVACGQAHARPVPPMESGAQVSNNGWSPRSRRGAARSSPS